MYKRYINSIIIIIIMKSKVFFIQSKKWVNSWK